MNYLNASMSYICTRELLEYDNETLELKTELPEYEHYFYLNIGVLCWSRSELPERELVTWRTNYLRIRPDYMSKY